jgi:hypothetical protein
MRQVSAGEVVVVIAEERKKEGGREPQSRFQILMRMRSEETQSPAKLNCTEKHGRCE